MSELSEQIAAYSTIESIVKENPPSRDFPLSLPAHIFPTLIRILTFFLLFSFSGALSIGASFVFSYGPMEGFGMLITGVGLILGAIFSYYFVAKKLEGRFPEELSIKGFSDLLYGIGLGSSAILLSAVIISLMGGLSFKAARPIQEIAWVEHLIMTGFFSGVVEEIIFRGILFRYFEQKSGSLTAIIGSSILFGIGHLLSPGANIFTVLASVIEAGFFFSIIYIITRSLWWVIGTHAAWNFVQSIILGIPVSGNFNEGLIVSQANGPDILSGGSYGLEASIVTFILISSLSALSFWWAHKEGLLLSRDSVQQYMNHIGS